MSEEKTISCLLEWRYNYSNNNSNDKSFVVAGLPIKKSYTTLPTVGDVLTFTPMLITNYGNGYEIPQEPRNGKVISIEERPSTRFDYTVTLELQYDEKVMASEEEKEA
jgi:hypothetical protein